MRNQNVLAAISGKQIVGTVATESSNSPNYRLFLAFSDNSYLELYGAEIKVAVGLDKGSLKDIIRYAEKQPNTTMHIHKLEDRKSIEDLPPTKLKIMADYGPSYAWNENGAATIIADYFTGHPQYEQLKALENALEEWAGSLYENEDKPAGFTLEKFDKIGLSLAQQLADLLSDYGVLVTFVHEAKLRNKGRMTSKVEQNIVSIKP